MSFLPTLNRQSILTLHSATDNNPNDFKSISHENTQETRSNVGNDGRGEGGATEVGPSAPVTNKWKQTTAGLFS